jgi:hypothetical protein
MTNMPSKWIYPLSFVISASGFLLPFWPLSVAGILVAAFAKKYIFAVIIGLLIDIAFGAPTRFYYLYFPFALAGLIGVIIRILADKYILDKDYPETV